MRGLLFSALLLPALAPCPALANGLLLMKAGDISGSHEDAFHQGRYDGWSELTGWQVFLDKVDPPVGSTRGGPTRWGDGVFSMEIDQAYVSLIQAGLQGLVFEEFRVHQFHDDGRQLLEHNLGVAALQDLTTTQATGQPPRLVGHVVPEVYEVRHHLYDAMGQPIGVQETSWNFNEGTAALVFVPTLPGDYDASGYVDAADYTRWREEFGRDGFGLTADGNRDGVVDAADYTVWRDNLGSFASPMAGATAAPAPASVTLIAALACLGVWRRPS